MTIKFSLSSLGNFFSKIVDVSILDYCASKEQIDPVMKTRWPFSSHAESMKFVISNSISGELKEKSFLFHWVLHQRQDRLLKCLVTHDLQKKKKKIIQNALTWRIEWTYQLKTTFPSNSYEHFYMHKTTTYIHHFLRHYLLSSNKFLPFAKLSLDLFVSFEKSIPPFHLLFCSHYLMYQLPIT